jgi:hypothetical protein
MGKTLYFHSHFSFFPSSLLTQKLPQTVRQMLISNSFLHSHFSPSPFLLITQQLPATTGEADASATVFLPPIFLSAAKSFLSLTRFPS